MYIYLCRSREFSLFYSIRYFRIHSIINIINLCPLIQYTAPPVSLLISISPDVKQRSISQWQMGYVELYTITHTTSRHGFHFCHSWVYFVFLAETEFSNLPTCTCGWTWTWTYTRSCFYWQNNTFLMAAFFHMNNFLIKINKVTCSSATQKFVSKYIRLILVTH